MIAILIFSVPLGIVLGIILFPFFRKVRKCPVCSSPVVFLSYWHGVSCRACRTRFVISQKRLIRASDLL